MADALEQPSNLTDTPPEPQKATPPDVSGDGQTPSDPPSGSNVDKTFTQAELDRIVAERLARNQAKYRDYDELKASAGKWAEHEKAQQSELERLQETTQAAQAERDAALQRAQDLLIRSAFVAEAAKVGATYPEDVYALADISDVIIDDNNRVIGVTDAVKALVDAGRLVMKGKPAPPTLNGGAGGGARATETAIKLTPEEQEAARTLGMTPEDYAMSKSARTYADFVALSKK